MKTNMRRFAGVVALSLLSTLGISQVSNMDASFGQVAATNIVDAVYPDNSGGIEPGFVPGPFTVRPSSYINGFIPYLNPTYAYDGNLNTASTGTVNEAIKGAKSAIETWDGFPATPPGATGMKLNITSSASVTRGLGVTLSYSLNGGSTFTTVYFLESGSRSKQTDMVALSNSQDLTKVQVKGEATAFSDGTFISTDTQSIFEISVTGND
jgi:hypothetical protein